MRSQESTVRKAESSQSRRRFLKSFTAVAGFTAVTGAVTKAVAYSRPVWRPPEEPGPACFLRGTTIRTDKGEVSVEALSIGDLVITASGAVRPIKWIGQRKYRRDEEANWPSQIVPIRVARSALADNVPSVDLYLSPLHALYVDGVLIPVKHLVNGTTIRPAMPESAEDIEYFHVELESHDVIFAGGAPVETYRELDNREMFSNFAQFYRMYGRPETSTPAYAPYLHYRGRRDLVKARLRLGLSRVVDVRDPIQVLRDRLADRSALIAG